MPQSKVRLPNFQREGADPPSSDTLDPAFSLNASKKENTMKFLKENKNYIKAIALALVILMCTPFLTLNAIETMSGGRSMEVTTGATTSDIQSWKNIDHATKAAILADAVGYPTWQVGNNPDIYYNSEGYIVLCGTGPYKGHSYTTTLKRSWYL